MANPHMNPIKIGDVIDGLKVMESVKAPRNASANEKRFLFWKVECESCGDESVVSTRFLRSRRKTTACQKCRKESSLRTGDLTGREFGKLTVTKNAVNGNSKTVHAKCRCGGSIDVSRDSLLSGRAENCPKCETRSRHRQDKTGKKFGNLTVVRDVPRPENFTTGRDKWYLCRCDCGQVIETRSYTLRHDDSPKAVNNCGAHGIGMRYKVSSDQLKKRIVVDDDGE